MVLIFSLMTFLLFTALSGHAVSTACGDPKRSAAEQYACLSQTQLSSELLYPSLRLYWS